MPCMDPFTVKPISRDCVCPPGVQHTGECNAAYKAKLVNAQLTVRRTVAQYFRAASN